METRNRKEEKKKKKSLLRMSPEGRSAPERRGGVKGPGRGSLSERVGAGYRYGGQQIARGGASKGWRKQTYGIGRSTWHTEARDIRQGLGVDGGHTSSVGGRRSRSSRMGGWRGEVGMEEVRNKTSRG